MQDGRRGFGETSPRRPRTNGSNGYRPEAAHARPVPFAELADEPVDLVAVQADDELINALAAGMSVSAPGFGGYDADDKVAALLAAWRAEVEAEPIPELVDLDTATSVVLAASRPSRRRGRHLVSISAAAAVILVALGSGVTIGAGEAEPGDPLWAVSRVLFSERAESVEAAERVETVIAEAKDALTRGEPEVAAQKLAEIEDDLLVVRAEEGKAELAEVQDFLEAKAAETPPGTPTDPGTPLVSDRTRPVPAGAATRPAVAPQPEPEEPAEAATTTPEEPASEVPEPQVDPRIAEEPPPGEEGPESDPGTDPTSSPEGTTDPELEEPDPPLDEGGEESNPPLTEGGPSPGTGAVPGSSVGPTASGASPSATDPAPPS